MSPKHSLDFCPICGGGLCGIRICAIRSGGVDPDQRADQRPDQRASSDAESPHGLVICDECEALWLEPDLTTAHQYLDAEEPRCPICQERLWSNHSRWANAADVETLGWEFAVNPKLDVADDDEAT